MFKTGIGGMIIAGCIILLIVNPLSTPISLALYSLVCGYTLRLIRYKSLNPAAKLPDWDDWMELFISGLTWLAIQFGLSLIPLTAVSTSLLVAGATGAIKIGSGVAFVVWLVTTIAVMTAICTVLSFLTPLLMVNFAIEERVQAGFSFVKVIRKAAKDPRDYLVAWLLSIGVAWCTVVLPVVTLIGIFFIPSTIFIGHIVCATLFAQVWGEHK